MNRFVPILALVALTSCAANQTLSTSTRFSNHPLIGSLMGSFGLTTDQAVGGAGALLALGQNQMTAAHWTRLESAVPDVSDIIQSAKALGGIASTPNSLAELADPFAKLGLSRQQVAMLIPAVADHVSRTAGPEVGGAFAAAMK